MLFNLTCDVAYDTLEEFMKLLEKCSNEYNLMYCINQFEGSGGGFPDMTFTGLKEDLKKFWDTEMFGGDSFEDYFDEYGSEFHIN